MLSQRTILRTRYTSNGIGWGRADGRENAAVQTPVTSYMNIDRYDLPLNVRFLLYFGFGRFDVNPCLGYHLLSNSGRQDITSTRD